MSRFEATWLEYNCVLMVLCSDIEIASKIVIKNCSIFCRKHKRRVTAFFRSKLKVCTIMRSLNATFILTWLMKINRFKDLDHFYVGYSSLSYNLSGLINFMMDVANQHNNGFRNSDHNPNLTTCFNRRMKNFESPWLPQILRFQISFFFFISPIQYIFQNKFSFSYVLDSTRQLIQIVLQSDASLSNLLCQTVGFHYQ